MHMNCPRKKHCKTQSKTFGTASAYYSMGKGFGRLCENSSPEAQLCGTFYP